MEDKIIEILRNHSESAKRTVGNGCNYEHYIITRDYEKIAQELVKLFAMPAVINRRELLVAFLEFLYNKDNHLPTSKLSIIDGFLATNSL